VAGGAVNGNAGTTGNPGSASQFSSGNTVTKVPLAYADGGAGGVHGAANSTTSVGGGIWGGAIYGGNTSTSTPGCGGQSTSVQGNGVTPTPYGVGGAAGAPASASFGGNGGSVATKWGQGLASVTGVTASTTGGVGAGSTVAGCGGAGGGGGAPGGLGGGGAGANGWVSATLVVQ
jgi:hypothetical protein